MTQCVKPECLYKNPEESRFCQRCGSNLQLRKRYQAQQILGNHGLGRTFLAKDERKSTQFPCVIKRFLPQEQGTEDPETAAQIFEKQAKRLKQLSQHPKIPNLLSYFLEDGQQYLVQEYVEGEDLKQVVAEKGAFYESQIRDLLQQILPVLEYAHQRNTIHRDIKPENLIRTDAERLMLVDFSAAERDARTSISVMGIGNSIGPSPGYAAPEQVFRAAQPSSDLYSLGVTCLHLLTQTEPLDLFDLSENDWMWRDCVVYPISDRMGQILDRAIIQATKRRYQSATEMLEDLDKLPQQTFISHPSGDTTSVQLESEPDSQPASKTDYSHLQDLLAAGKWEEADRETVTLLLQIANREEEGWLSGDDIANFPCEALREIDQLWVQYTQGHFGLSVQNQIYQELGGSKTYEREIWEQFCDRVGWRQNGMWLSYTDVLLAAYYTSGNLESNTVKGHLPAGYVFNCVEIGIDLISRVAECHV